MGLTKEFWDGELVMTDIVKTPWVDLKMDAEDMNVEDSSFDNVICFDTIHHLKIPHQFFDEAQRVLKPDGRLFAIEPWISPVSFVFYKLMHHEGIRFDFYNESPEAEKDPMSGNLAMCNILFARENWAARHPNLEIMHFDKMDFLGFQVTGGFRPWALVRSEKLYKRCLEMDALLRFAMPLLAFRVMIVLRKTV